MILTTVFRRIALQTGAIDLLLTGWPVIVGLLGVGLLAFWWFDERDDNDRWEDTVERVGERAQAATGGAVGAFGSLVVVIFGIAATIGHELVMSLAELSGPVAEFPALVGGAGIGLLGTIGLSGIVPIKGWQFGVIVLVVLLLASYGVFRVRGRAAA